MKGMRHQHLAQAVYFLRSEKDYGMLLENQQNNNL
jgi:hypothetical protein